MMYGNIWNVMTLFIRMSEDRSPQEQLKKLSLYKEFIAERDEIYKHKWIESEKAGYDIGFEHALVDWIMNHRKNWKKSRNLK